MEKSRTDLVTVVGPGAKLEAAGLVVEGEVGDVHLAGALQLGGHGPEDVAGELDHGVGRHQAVRVLSGTGDSGQRSLLEGWTE